MLRPNRLAFSRLLSPSANSDGLRGPSGYTAASDLTTTRRTASDLPAAPNSARLPTTARSWASLAPKSADRSVVSRWTTVSGSIWSTWSASAVRSSPIMMKGEANWPRGGSSSTPKTSVSGRCSSEATTWPPVHVEAPVTRMRRIGEH